MWGIATVDLHLTTEQFWNLCPIEFDALLNRWILQEERADRRTSLLATLLVNINKSKKGKSAKLQDFMLHDFRGTQPQGQSWQQQLSMLKALQSRFTAAKRAN